MRMQTFKSGFRSMLAGVMVAVSMGCGVELEETPDVATRGAEAADGPNLTTVEQELSQTYKHDHGGNLYENAFNVVMGGACAAGHTRTAKSIWHTGAGACWDLGWYSNDPSDCRINVRIQNSAMFV